MTSRRIALVSFIISTVAILGGIALLLAAQQPAAQAVDIPVMGSAPAIELTGEDGDAFSSEELAGHYWIASFFFTSCTGICPVTQGNMAVLQQQYGPETGLQFVSISVDPGHDTPDILRAHGESLGANFDRWHFLTGDMDVIKDLSFHGFRAGSLDAPAQHSSRFILVDPQGNIRGYYDATDPSAMARLKTDLDILLQ